MSVQNGERLATKQDLADFYDNIRPYMGGIVTSKAGFTPIGTIISVMGTTAPANYLACDGTVYNIADYTDLANYFNEQFGSKNFFGGNGTTTFAVPDLRGEFLRGAGTNSHTNQGSGANVGEHQDATNFPQFGISTSAEKGFYGVAKSTASGITNSDSTHTASTNGVTFSKGETWSSGSANVYNTSRPTNTSVLYCIATKNFYIDPTLDYSTEEKIVGTWIDGKPVYQKTWTGQTTTGTEVDLFSLTGANKIIDIDGFLHNNGYYFHFNYAQGTGNYFSIFAKDNVIKLRKQVNTDYDYAITVQYTKV